jgi:hypothetical protein
VVGSLNARYSAQKNTFSKTQNLKEVKSFWFEQFRGEWINTRFSAHFLFVLIFCGQLIELNAWNQKD